jgi:hypothetical protein
MMVAVMVMLATNGDAVHELGMLAGGRAGVKFDVVSSAAQPRLGVRQLAAAF